MGVVRTLFDFFVACLLGGGTREEGLPEIGDGEDRLDTLVVPGCQKRSRKSLHSANRGHRRLTESLGGGRKTCGPEEILYNVIIRRVHVLRKLHPPRMPGEAIARH